MLSQLKYLYLSSNTIHGIIPQELGMLLQLQDLYLDDNNINGVLPIEVGELKSLRKIDLSRNRLNSSLLHLGNSTSFSYLNVSQNNLTSFPLSKGWKHLETFDLRNNRIHQEMSVNLADLISIKELFLSNNSFYGSIPNTISSLNHMEILHLDHNYLTGDIPDDVLSLVRLKELKLSHSKQKRHCFEGLGGCDVDVVDYVGGDICCYGKNGEKICSAEIGVEINNNNICITAGLRGPIPAGFTNTPYLQVLDLSNNFLTGNIPPEIGGLFRLEMLDLTNNTLTGSIPSVLGALASAAVLVQGNGMIRGPTKNETIAPLSLCSNVPKFDLSGDSIWCPPERNVLRAFYNDAKGQEWTISTGWVDEFNNHCEWYGVECNEVGKIVELSLNNGGLSGKISDAICNLKSIERLDFRDNNLKGSIPSGIGNLSELTSFIVSYNEITGIIPDGFANLSKLEIVHLHGNRLQGAVPFLSLKGQTKSSFIADCGSPSVFDSPLDCPSCSMCCNSKQECDAKKSKTNFGKWSSVFVASVVFALLLASTGLIQKIFSFGQGVSSTGNECCTIGKDSVYCFFLSNRFTAWALAIGVLATQTLCFGFFINEASLEFRSDRIWRYTYTCPRNNLDCRNNSDVTAFGWIVFTVFALVYLMCDLLNGLKLVLGASKYGLTRKGFQSFFGGCSLFVITALALYATVVYNIAASRSNFEMIFNTVILLFVNDLDEKLFASLHAISPEWLKKTRSEIIASFNGKTRTSVQNAIINQQIEDQTKRIKKTEKKLAKKSNAIKAVEAKNSKLKKKVAGLKAAQAIKSKDMKRVKAKNKELDKKVLELEHFKEQVNRRLDDIERSQAGVKDQRKKLK